jgi:hypothetical protein
MTANHKPQRDYVIEAINDLLADEEAEVLPPAHDHDLGSRRKRPSSGDALLPPRSSVPAEFSRKDTGTVIPIREASRQGRR